MDQIPGNCIYVLASSCRPPEKICFCRWPGHAHSTEVLPIKWPYWGVWIPRVPQACTPCLSVWPKCLFPSVYRAHFSFIVTGNAELHGALSNLRSGPGCFSRVLHSPQRVWRGPGGPRMVRPAGPLTLPTALLLCAHHRGLRSTPVSPIFWLTRSLRLWSLTYCWEWSLLKHFSFVFIFKFSAFYWISWGASSPWCCLWVCYHFGGELIFSSTYFLISVPIHASSSLVCHHLFLKISLFCFMIVFYYSNYFIDFCDW